MYTLIYKLYDETGIKDIRISRIRWLGQLCRLRETDIGRKIFINIKGKRKAG